MPHTATGLAASTAQAAEAQPRGAAPMGVAGLPVTLQPHRNLLKYYMLTALAFGPAFIFAAPPLYFRFRTLRYDVDGQGITMRWGILFRKEISLAYARIQDIQLSSNVVERWFGLARIQLQTASGSASAEMTIEGIRDVEAMRDFLYSRMRGTADTVATADVAAAGDDATAAGSDDIAQITAALDAATAELRALRLSLAGGRQDGAHD